ncbi:uncharacterized protein [Clytia hemisphaerica]|uniref:uncharacterized protein n=1 Tax=Clytia hemisphaerica TaxID=252671 RepID=UPI0034D623B5
MRSDLGLSWEKMKAMARWMLSFNIEMASNHKQRKVSREWAGELFAVEMSPFLFEKKDRKGQYHILSAPWSHVKNLPSFVVDYVDKLDNENQLIHHPQMNQEIHVKLGGDHGGKSFKGVMQVCNTSKPNSQDNTVIFSYFEAKDYEQI